MKIIATAGAAALFITVWPLAQPVALAGGDSGSYAGGSRYGPEAGEVFGHRHRGARARAHAGGGATARAQAGGGAAAKTSLQDYNGAPNGGFFVNGTFYPATTNQDIWRK
jgi:hypothetical protein